MVYSGKYSEINDTFEDEENHETNEDKHKDRYEHKL